jgi:hypothetical protein
MAHDVAKKNSKRNAVRIAKFRTITLVINALYILLTVLINQSFIPYISDVLWLFFWFSQEWLMITLLATRGAPATDDQGEIIDCSDLAIAESLGMFSYAQDTLWLCWGVQSLTLLVSRWFFAVYLVIPGFALYKAWGFIIYPLLSKVLGGGQQQQQQQPMPQQPQELDAKGKLKGKLQAKLAEKQRAGPGRR